jgi:hypothetical protein
LGYRQLLPPPRPPVPVRPHSFSPEAVATQQKRAVQGLGKGPGQKRSLTLGDEQIINLSMRGDVLAVVPKFAHYRPKASGGGCRCSRKSNELKVKRDALNALKEVLQNLSNDERIKLKQVLMATELVFYVRTAAGVEQRTI